MGGRKRRKRKRSAINLVAGESSPPRAHKPDLSGRATRRCGFTALDGAPEGGEESDSTRGRCGRARRPPIRRGCGVGPVRCPFSGCCGGARSQPAEGSPPPFFRGTWVILLIYLFSSIAAPDVVCSMSGRCAEHRGWEAPRAPVSPLPRDGQTSGPFPRVLRRFKPKPRGSSPPRGGFCSKPRSCARPRGLSARGEAAFAGARPCGASWSQSAYLGHLAERRGLINFFPL